MWWKLFTGTFLLILLAEIGDKTQFLIMARAASADRARWVVFAASSLALVVSTMIAVLLGGFVSRFSARGVRLFAGAVFVIFGLLMIRDAWRTVPEHMPEAVSNGGKMMDGAGQDTDADE